MDNHELEQLIRQIVIEQMQPLYGQMVDLEQYVRHRSESMLPPGYLENDFTDDDGNDD